MIFVHHEPDEEIPKNTLSYEFHFSEDRWENYKQFKMTRIPQESWHVARFPVILAKKNLRKLKKYLKTQQ